ncbi:metalloregulator ArsR/SmtB family transcription factor (plasmid) [Sulfitobacter faviae]|uniref:Metalloregulator ArsR/SmtB family transcription factor n=1 Tax=Sulfitobacter faviae TaxID=1775881 RepID=A0ABZ0V669_9RHOB|nr:metalloregulator ArsR/SmtB family transcription factor [Sulfitobacter faviae]WPZ23929.1 metalloregulator ArsR/SmtB family transcription factor [Sulfitobacter faviae]
MSSDVLEKEVWSPRSASERVLMALKMHGALTSTEVGARLGTTGEAARQQLLKLAEDDLVADERRPFGRGRPSVRWRLTKKGQSRFPDTHAALTVDILRSISGVLGEEALDRIIRAREWKTQALYEEAMADCVTLRDRLDKLVELRNAEGYMAAAEEGEDGEFRLVENHCPICAAATVCQGFCRAEKSVFENVLGDGISVERVEHIVSGGRRCTYVIREAS